MFDQTTMKLAEKIFQVEYRRDVFRMKLRGLLPELTWLEICSMLITSGGRWPVEKLAVPDGGPDPISPLRFKTRIGEIYWAAPARKMLALLVLDQIRGVYEQGPVRIRKGDVVLDLGAHVGTFTQYALSRGAAKVVAFEAEPSHIAYLRQTFAREIQGGRVHLVEAAAWHEACQLHFHASGVASHVVSEGGISVNATTVDETVANLGLERVDFLKADIEGAERHALKGAVKTLARDAPALALCIYHLPDDPSVISELVKAHKLYRIAMNPGRSQLYCWSERHSSQQAKAAAAVA